MNGIEDDFEKKDWEDQGDEDELDGEEFAEEEIVSDEDEEEQAAPHSDIEKAAQTAVQTLDALKQAMKRSKKRKRRRKKTNPFLLLLFFILVLVGSIFILNSDLFAIKNIEVEGNRYYNPAQIIEMSGIESGKNMFFELKPRTARNNLLKSPYILTAKIERRPISTVRIVIEERLEYAAISYGETFVVIDKDGMTLRITETPPDVTILEGIEIEEPEEGKPIKVRQTYLFSETLRLLTAMKDNDIYFSKVYFSAAVVRAYIGDDYYCEGAPENIFKSISAIKELLMQHAAQNISKGVIKVGTDGYLSFNPRID